MMPSHGHAPVCAAALSAMADLKRCGKQELRRNRSASSLISGRIQTANAKIRGLSAIVFSHQIEQRVGLCRRKGADFTVMFERKNKELSGAAWFQTCGTFAASRQAWNFGPSQSPASTMGL